MFLYNDTYCCSSPKSKYNSVTHYRDTKPLEGIFHGVPQTYTHNTDTMFILGRRNTVYLIIFVLSVRCIIIYSILFLGIKFGTCSFHSFILNHPFLLQALTNICISCLCYCSIYEVFSFRFHLLIFIFVITIKSLKLQALQ